MIVRPVHKYKQQVRAHSAVAAARRRGELVKQPCEKCGSVDRVEAHHDDYSKPLEVRWLCRFHHDGEHYGKPSPGASDPNVCVHNIRMDRETWTKFKSRCSAEGMTATSVIRLLLGHAILYGLPEPPKKDK